MMKKRLFLYIAGGVTVAAVICGLWVYWKFRPVKPGGDGDGRFDFYLYTVDEDNTIIPFTPPLDNPVIPDKPPLVYFESLKNTYLYLLLFTPEKEMTVLFPDTNGNFPRNYQFTRYFFPQDNNWQPYLPVSGQYTLCFLFSTGRLPTIERLLSGYALSGTAGKPGTAKLEILAKLQAEIGKYQREQEWIKNTGEIPSWIGGTVRSSQDEIIYKAWSVPFREIIIHNIIFDYTAGPEYG